MASTEPPVQAQAPAAEAPAAAETAAAGAAQKPKKAVSAYWLFGSKVREELTKELKEKNGGKVSLGEVAKATTLRWNALSEEEKKEFEDKAAEDKKRYAEEFKAYLEASDPAGNLRAKYAHLIPKRPMTAYFLFLQEPAQKEKAVAALKEASGSEPAHKQVVGKLAEMWKALGAEEKAPFEERHKQEHAEFLKKQTEWQATPEFKEIEAAAKKQAEQQKEEGQEALTPSRGAKRSRSAAKTSSPQGEAKKEAQQSPASAVKRAKKASQAQEPQAAIEPEVLADASKAGLEGMLRNLASRPEVVAAGKTSRQIFEALKASGGLVNPAKRALVGAGGA